MIQPAAGRRPKEWNEALGMKRHCLRFRHRVWHGVAAAVCVSAAWGPFGSGPALAAERAVLCEEFTSDT